MKFITIGDNVADCYVHQGLYYPGGNAVNVAVNLKKCGADYVEYIGIFGNDEKASHIEKSMNLEGVNTDKCRKVFAKSGQPYVNIDENGERFFAKSDKDTAQHLFSLRFNEAEYEYLKNFDLMHTSCYSGIDHLLEKMSRFVKISYDFSDEADIVRIRKVARKLDYVFFSGADRTDTEIKELIALCHKSGAHLVCVTLGAGGSLCSDGEKIYKTDIVKTELVDTMGAGDGYIAGFLYKYTQRRDVQEAMEFGAKMAAKACEISGGFGHPEKLEI